MIFVYCIEVQLNVWTTSLFGSLVKVLAKEKIINILFSTDHRHQFVPIHPFSFILCTTCLTSDVFKDSLAIQFSKIILTSSLLLDFLVMATSVFLCAASSLSVFKGWMACKQRHHFLERVK